MEPRAFGLVCVSSSRATLWRGAVRLGLMGCLGLSVSCGDRHEPLDPDAPAIRQIDHVLVVSSQADALFGLFADVFQCPVVWPMAEHGGFASGGVSLGNVNLEIIRDTGPADGDTASRFTGLALEAEPLDVCLPALAARGVPFGRPSSHRSGLFTTLWTTVGLPGVSSETTNVFICEYGSTIRQDLSQRRQRARDELRARGGGPLSLDSVREVVIAATDPAGVSAGWQALLHPTRPTASGLWPFSAGPALRIVTDAEEQDGIAALVLQVDSLEQARAFLRSQGLLAIDEQEKLSIASPPAAGLRLLLVGQVRSATVRVDGFDSGGPY